MNINEKISEAELEILKLLWSSREALSSAYINDALMNIMGWEKSTVRTLVRRLTEKGALIQEKRDMYYYYPAITEKEYVSAQTKSFLEKMYKGNAKKLVASLFEQEYIRPGDLENIKEFWKKGESGHDEGNC